jgi:putative ABC transport system permease protein
MFPLFVLAARSAWGRRSSLVLLLISIMMSTVLLLGIDMVRQSARSSFSNAVSGTDLIVGAQNSPVSLLLYSVFRMGEPSRNVPISVYDSLKTNPAVKHAIPISLGDSYKGFSVVSTSANYFQDFRYGERQALVLEQGREFSDYQVGMPYSVVFEAVLGAEVAGALGHRLGDSIALTHGAALQGGGTHADKPFKVVGILAPTGTPVDRSVHISLQAMEAIHVDWQAGVPITKGHIAAEQVTKFDLQPKVVTAILLSLNNRAGVFRMQRHLQDNPEVALTALLPGVALSALWDTVGMAERALLFVAGLVACVSALGLISVMLVALSQRRRELAVLRSVGAGPGVVFGLVCLESTLVMLLGVGLGFMLTLALSLGLASWVQAHFGFVLVSAWSLKTGLMCVAAFAVLGSLLGIVPAWQAYRQQLQEGLVPRV